VITYTPRTRALLWKTPDDFGQKYCRNCQCGWTREGKDSEGKDNAVLTICLLDREPIMEGITRCDRFEPKEEEALDLLGQRRDVDAVRRRSPG
jgi:hypothetical protein